MKNFLLAGALLGAAHWAVAQPATQKQVDNQYAVLEQLHFRTQEYTSDTTRQGVLVRTDYSNYRYAIKGRTLIIQFNSFVNFLQGGEAFKNAGLFFRTVYEVDLQDITGVQLTAAHSKAATEKCLVLKTQPNAVTEVFESRESTGTKLEDQQKKTSVTNIYIDRIGGFADSNAEQQFIDSFNQLLACYQAKKQ